MNRLIDLASAAAVTALLTAGCSGQDAADKATHRAGCP